MTDVTDISHQVVGFSEDVNFARIEMFDTPIGKVLQNLIDKDDLKVVPRMIVDENGNVTDILSFDILRKEETDIS